MTLAQIIELNAKLATLLQLILLSKDGDKADSTPKTKLQDFLQQQNKQISELLNFDHSIAKDQIQYQKAIYSGFRHFRDLRNGDTFTTQGPVAILFACKTLEHLILVSELLINDTISSETKGHLLGLCQEIMQMPKDMERLSNVVHQFYLDFIKNQFLKNPKTVMELEILERVPGDWTAVVKSLLPIATVLKTKYTLNIAAETQMLCLTAVGRLIRATGAFGKGRFHIVRFDAAIQRCGVGTFLLQQVCDAVKKSAEYQKIDLLAEGPAVDFYTKFFKRYYALEPKDIITGGFGKGDTCLDITRDQILGIKKASPLSAFRSATAADLTPHASVLFDRISTSPLPSIREETTANDSDTEEEIDPIEEMFAGATCRPRYPLLFSNKFLRLPPKIDKFSDVKPETSELKQSVEELQFTVTPDQLESLAVSGAAAVASFHRDETSCTAYTQLLSRTFLRPSVYEVMDWLEVEPARNKIKINSKL